MLHPELRKWLGGNVRLWVTAVVLLGLWAFTDSLLIALIGATVAYFRLARPIEERLGRGNAALGNGRYGERRYSFEDPEPLAEEEFLPRYSAPIEAAPPVDETEDEDDIPDMPAPAPTPLPSRPMSSVKVPPRKPVDLPRRR